ncbi:TRAP transporter small permease [Marinobacter sp. 2_MG-2023]|uniref:TRAP transporter small permease n=1 Tax=Marinobacter sp. 2_MG-2023 TaxID=3062679 RepID=UPI0026E34948|nr:TRAP transporter small permease [Marinobacter sp. 2_MG-2023]MDO6441971.1 TRAP transporter small permease [Marinobacter sp. 2_MG-2023]
MRRALDAFYKLGGALSALSLTLIMVLIVAQVLGRVLDKLMGWAGFDAMGLTVPGLAEIAAFLLLGATFFGLGYTFWQGGHIRVTLVLQHLPKPLHRFMDILVTLVAASVTAFAAWHSARLALDSHDFGDLSIGMVPVPLWIPQAVMTLGLIWLLIALLDALFLLASGRISQLVNDAPEE